MYSLQDHIAYRRKTEAHPKQPGVALWRRREADKDEAHGQEQDGQQTTASSGGKMSGPSGTKGFNYLEHTRTYRQLNAKTQNEINVS